MSAADAEKHEIIIVRRGGEGEDGHHGGAWKIAFAYDLYTNPTPGYGDTEDWKSGYYAKYRDTRAVDETVAMMRDSAHAVTWFHSLVTGYDLGPDFYWDVAARAVTPAEKLESMKAQWQAYLDATNGK